MRHVILGAGGIGGLLAAVLGRAGQHVTVVVRRSSLEAQPRTSTVRSAMFGELSAPVELADTVPGGADILWITVKSTGLSAALDLADPGRVQAAPVVPLLNGIDHVRELQRRYSVVCPATIRVESHRVAPGVVEHRSPFAHIGLARGQGDSSAAVHALDVLGRSGFATSITDDATSLLWDKLAFLAPVALATTAWDRELGSVRNRPEFRSCQAEAVAAARADGATTDLRTLDVLTGAAPESLRSSMQLDVRAGREPELDAIAGAILRRAPTGGAPATRALAERIEARCARSRRAVPL